LRRTLTAEIKVNYKIDLDIRSHLVKLSLMLLNYCPWHGLAIDKEVCKIDMKSIYTMVHLSCWSDTRAHRPWAFAIKQMGKRTKSLEWRKIVKYLQAAIQMHY